MLSEDKTEKEAYCFLVRHYISKFCKLKDDSATFSCQLSKGHAAAENVKLDIKVINESLKARNIPLEIGDGLFKKIDVLMPFNEASKDSFEIKVSGLELKLHPKRTPKESSIKDLVTSALDIVINSMSTFTEVAECLAKNAKTSGKYGISDLVKIIDRLASQLRVRFLESIILVEGCPEPATGLRRCVELEIEWLELIDQQVDQESGPSENSLLKNQSDLLLKNKDSAANSSSETTSTVEKVVSKNKVVRTRGIRLFTHFSRIKMNRIQFAEVLGKEQYIYICTERGNEKNKPFDQALFTRLANLVDHPTSKKQSVTDGNTPLELSPVIATDPVSFTVKNLVTEMNAIPDSIESYEKKVETFFDEAKSFELNAHGTLRDYRETFDRFFSEDQLSFCGISVIFEYTLTRLVDNLIMELQFGVREFGLGEILRPSSIKETSTEKLSYNELLCFPKSKENKTDDVDSMDIKFTLRNSKKEEVGRIILFAIY
ncbi:unnamed protein product [Enterobius vermicularis]|uniref:Autophagy-related protein 2 n=1 Tax=Enterobius vermicularis TaxID=51028 RepID=A0A0N4VJV1_ENTVE|nr:unnamed protein product [Enterobius vermicularis]